MEHERAVQNLAVESYLLGEMASGEREAFEEHYFECAICAEDLRSASRFIADAKEFLARDGGPARAVSPREEPEQKQSGWTWLQWLQPQFAAVAIALLAVVAGVESLATIPSLRSRLEQASTPRIVKATVLRPQTRGEATLVKVAPGDPAVLMFDLPESPASRLQFVVESTDGRAVLQLSGAAPGPGEPVNLSIPRLDLPAGKYTLIVRPEAGTEESVQELGRYPFELKKE